MRAIIVFLFCWTLSGCYLSDHQMRKTNGAELNSETKNCHALINPNKNELNEIKDLYLIEDCMHGENKAKFIFGVIEFDDFGQLRSHEQFKNVLEAVRKKVESKRVVFSLFIHGWKHNASEGSKNLNDFRKFVINSAVNGPCKLKGNNDFTDQCDSIGIYIAWRGDSTGLTEHVNHDSKFSTVKSILQSVSIDNRKKAAKRISSTRSTQVILDLLRTVNRADTLRLNEVMNQQLSSNTNINLEKYQFSDLPCYAIDDLTKGNSNYYNTEINEIYVKENLAKLSEGCSYKQLVGHSFGGRFLENALAQSLVGQINTALQLDLDKDLKNIVDEYAFYQSQKKKLQMRTDELTQDIVILETAKETLEKLKDELKNQVTEQQGQLKKIETIPRYKEYEKDASDAYANIKIAEISALHSKIIETYDNPIYLSCFVDQSAKDKFLNQTFPQPIQVKSISAYNNFYRQIIPIAKSIRRLFNRNKRNNETNYCNTPEITQFKKYSVDGDNITSYLKEQGKEIDDWIRFNSKELKKLGDVQSKIIETLKELSEKEIVLFEMGIEIDKKRDDIENKKKELITYNDNMLKAFLKITTLYEKTLTPVADLILLLNPATEAISAKMLSHSFCQLSNEEEFGLPNIRPWIVTISSEDDKATDWAFPFFVASKFTLGITGSKPRSKIDSQNSHDDSCSNFSEQLHLTTRTAPFIEAMNTHNLSLIKDDQIDQLECVDLDENVFSFDDFWRNYKANNVKNNQPQPNFELEKLVDEQVYEGSMVQRYFHNNYKCKNPLNGNLMVLGEAMYELREISTKKPKIGYWNMKVDGNLIKGHNDIFNEKVGAIIYALMAKGLNSSICDNVSYIKDSNSTKDEKDKFYKYCKSEYSNDLANLIARKIVKPKSASTDINP